MTEDLAWLPAWRLRELLDTRQITAVEIAERLLSRIDRLEPSAHAFFTVTPELALEQAAASDRRIARNEVLGPLDGIPLSIKDNLEVAGVACSYGEAELADFVPRYDQISVDRLRRAGVVVLGKTNMPGRRDPGVVPEPALNPWAPDRVPGQSSAGAAVALANGMGPLALCTDGGGSSRLPAACCGLIGLHPTAARSPAYSYHRSSTRGILDATAAIMSRDVRDAATALSVIAGPDRRDPWRWPCDAPDYLAKLDAGVDGMRMAWSGDLGIPSNHDDADTPATLAALRSSAQELARLGALVDEPVLRVDDPEPLCITAVLMAKAEPSPAAPSVDAPSGLHGARAMDPELVELLHGRARLAAQLDELFDQYQILLVPTIRTVAATWGAWPESFAPWSLTVVSNLLGLPSLSVPAGFVRGLPVGLQLIGRADSEPDLLRAAHALLASRPEIPYPGRPG